MIPQSIFSSKSVLSTFSLLSTLSLLSFLSVCSIASVLSVGSITSMFSLMSVNSILSVGSNGCILKAFTDCSKRPSSAESITLTFPDSAWQQMKSCSYSEYRAEPRPSNCDYQPVDVAFAINGVNVQRRCEARRKGTSTWQTPDEKPSFKVKCSDKMLLGEYNCTGLQRCPVGTNNVNQWISKKFVLNNGGVVGSDYTSLAGVINMYKKWGEVDAYGLFRDIGKIATPQARWVNLKVFRESEEINTSLYVLLENLDDKEFMYKWFGTPGWALYEIDDNDWLFERDKGAFDDCTKTHCTLDTGNGTNKIVPIPNLVHNTTLAMFSKTSSARDDMIRYYVGELLTGHWDGACLREHTTNNHYMAQNTTSWYILPSGLDNTFQGCVTDLESDDHPTCVFMQQCMQDAECSDRFIEIYYHAERHVSKKTESCSKELSAPVLYTFVACFAPLIITVVAGLWLWRCKMSPPRRTPLADLL